MHDRPVSPRRRLGALALLTTLPRGCTPPAPATLDGPAFPVPASFAQSGTVLQKVGVVPEGNGPAADARRVPLHLRG